MMVLLVLMLLRLLRLLGLLGLLRFLGLPGLLRWLRLLRLLRLLVSLMLLMVGVTTRSTIVRGISCGSTVLTVLRFGGTQNIKTSSIVPHRTCMGHAAAL